MATGADPFQLPTGPGDKGSGQGSEGPGQGGGGGGGGGFTPPGGETIGDLFGGGTFLSGQGFDPSQGIFKRRKQGRSFFPQRNATQFNSGPLTGTPQTVGGGFQRNAQPTAARQVGPQPQAGVDPVLQKNFQDQLAPGLPNGLGFGLLGQLGQAGGFDPFGSQGLIGMLRQQGLQDAGAFQRRNQLQAQLSGGGDPALTAFAGLQGGLQGQSDLSRNLSNAQLQSAFQNQNRLFNLGGGALRGLEGTQNQEHLGRIQGQIQQGLQGGGFGEIAGGILGGGVGALFGGVGAGIGKNIGSNLF